MSRPILAYSPPHPQNWLVWQAQIKWFFEAKQNNQHKDDNNNSNNKKLKIYN